jgi:hypothetical protein
MKRDMDLVRELVLRVESFDPLTGGPAETFLNLNSAEPALQFDGFTVAEVHYHLRLLKDAGFLDTARELPGSAQVMAKGLSWSGHDFADSVRDADIWRETKAGAKKAGGFTIDILVALAKGFVKKKIEEHTGIRLDL